VKRSRHRYQRTLSRPAEVRGVGYLTGADVRLRFLPAPPSSGVVFVRADCEPRVPIPAHIGQVSGTARRTTLGKAPHQVGLVEHVLAALAGLRIDNCLIELDAPEPPGLDGSADAFVRALLAAGIRSQPTLKSIWAVERPVTVRAGRASLTLYPGEEDALKISYLLDYGIGAPIARQCCTRTLTPETFTNDLAPSRTFILESEVEELRRLGLGKRTTAADLIVFGRHGPIGNRLHHADEPARHKILDLVGDLSLLGVDLVGHIVAYRSGHELNIDLVKALMRQMSEPSAPPAESVPAVAPRVQVA
jgi:UDP-3-O-acyl N-acetylglucosamine deacetylase